MVKASETIADAGVFLLNSRAFKCKPRAKEATAKRRLSILLCVILLPSVFVGCAPQGRREIPAELREYERMASSLFHDELGSFSPNGNEEAKVKSVLVRIKEAYEQCDKQNALTLVAPDYTQAVLQSPTTAMTISRSDYFKGIGMEKMSVEDCKRLERKMSIAKIKLVKPQESADEMAAVITISYESKYFSPKFIEVLNFRPQGKNWVLSKRVSVPLYPKAPEYYHVQIYIGSASELDKQSEIMKNLALDDADIFLQRLLGAADYTNNRALPIDGLPKVVIAVFRDPPPVGSRVVINHAYYSEIGQRRGTFERDINIEKVNPWFFAITASTIHSPGDVNYEVYLGDALVGSTTYGRWGRSQQPDR